jgi:hypothetical protein
MIQQTGGKNFIIKIKDIKEYSKSAIILLLFCLDIFLIWKYFKGITLAEAFLTADAVLQTLQNITEG